MHVFRKNSGITRDLFASAIITSTLFFMLTGVRVSATGLTCTLSTVCTSPAVVVLNLASTSNSHAQLASQSGYTQLVCCSGVSGLSNSCGTTILKLSAVTNAHVAQNTDATFSQNACLSISSGSISVGYQASNCTGFDTTVVSMSAASNGHVGSSTKYTTKVCATAAATSLTFLTNASSENFPALSPGTIVATTSILTVTTDNSTGFTISAQRATSLATMSLIGTPSVTIPDKNPDWIAPAATTTAGNATASTTQPLTLQFRVRQAGTDTPNYSSTWWGSNDTTASALFGGIPSTTQTIINRSTSAVSTTTAFVLYNLNTPGTQQNGNYSGSVTYTATANP